MRQFDDEIMNILQEESELPKVVKDKASEAFTRIQSGDMDSYKHFRKKKSYVKAAAACAAILLVGTSAYAAASRLGIADFFAKRDMNMPREEVEKLVDTEVKQESAASDKKEDSLVDFRIREALCDSNQIVVEVEALPMDPEHYLLIPTDSGLDMPVTDLDIDGVTEGTVGEYAKAQGKEVLFVSAYVQDEHISNNSIDFTLESDGTMVIVIRADNVMKEDIMNLTCLGTYHTADASSVEDIVRNTFTFQLTDQSKSEEYVYEADEDTVLEHLGGFVFDQLVINKTELSLGVNIQSHVTKENISQKEKEQHSIWYRIYTEDGTELTMLKGSMGYADWTEDGIYQITETCEVMDLPDTLILKAYVGEEKTEYDTITVHLKK